MECICVSVTVRSLPGCLVSCTLFNMCIWHILWRSVIAVQAARIYLVGADVSPLAPLGAPAQQVAAAVPRHWRHKALAPCLFQVLDWDSRPELSGAAPFTEWALPACESLSCLELATKTSHAKTLTYLASFERLCDLPPLHRCKLIVMSLQPNQLLKNLHKTSHEE